MTFTTTTFEVIECEGPGGSYEVRVPKNVTLTVTKDGYPVNLSENKIRSDVAAKHYGVGKKRSKKKNEE